MNKLRRMIAVAGMAATLVAAPMVALGGDPDMPSGVTEHDGYAERCFYIGDLASCLQAFMDWWLDFSLL